MNKKITNNSPGRVSCVGLESYSNKKTSLNQSELSPDGLDNSIDHPCFQDTLIK